MTLEQDISCLYAAKNFSPHLQLGQLEQLQQSQFLIRLNEIIEKYGNETWDKIKERDQEFATLEDSSEEGRQKSQTIILGLCTHTYEQLEKEINREYKKQKKAGKLTAEDKNAYHQLMSELSPQYLFMFASGVAEEEARQNISQREQEAKKEMEEWRKQQDTKFENYLASAGINTPEGKTVWKVAHHIGGHFNNFIYNGENYDKLALRRHSKKGVMINPSELEKHLSIGIATGVLCAKEYAIIANEDEFAKFAMRWILQEIKQRLDKRLEFNLLDAVSVKKGDDELIYLRLDERELYK